MADDTIRLQLEMLGAEGVKELEQKLEDLKAEVPALAAALGQGEISAKEFDAELKRVATSAKNLETVVRGLKEAEQEAEQEARDLAAADKDLAAAAARAAQEARDEAGDLEMLAAAERHAAEMSRVVAREAREMAAAEDAAEAEVRALDAALEDLGRDAARAAAATDKVDDATKKGGKSTRDLGGAFLEVSRGLEDLQYGLGGVINNLPGIVSRFGGPAGLAAMVSITAVAVKTLYDNWGTLSGLWQEKNPFPKTAGDVAGLKRELDAATTAMEKLGEAGTGTAAQIEEYNRLRATTARLEKEIADQQERQAAARRIFEAPKATEAEAAAERAELLGEIRGPAARQLADAIAAGQDEAAKAKIERENANLKAWLKILDPTTEAAQINRVIDLLGDTKNRLQRERDRVAGEAAKLVEAAVVQGKLPEFRKVQEEMAKRPEAFRPEQVLAFKQAAPEALAEAAAFDEANRRAGEVGRERRKAQKDVDDARQKASTEMVGRLRDELAVIKGIGKLDDMADLLLAEAARMGKEGEAAFEHVRAGLDAGMRQALGLRGFAIPAGGEAAAAGPIGDLATQQAAAARGRAEAAAKGAGKEEAATAVRAEEVRIAERQQFAAKAGAIYAQAGAAGATPAQAFAATRQAVLQHLNRQIGVDRFGRAQFANRGMAAAEKGRIATEIAGQGREAAGKQFANLAGENINNTAKLTTVATRLDAQVVQLQAQAVRMRAAIENLDRKNQATMRGMGKH